MTTGLSDPAAGHSNTPHWNLWAGCATAVLLLGVVFLLAARPIVVTDVWWQIRTGMLILSGDQFPITHDVFSYTHVGSDWVNLPWLHQIVSAAAVHLGDLELLVFAKALICLLAGAAVVATAATLRRAGGEAGHQPAYTGWSILSTAFFLITLAASAPRFRQRPEIWTFLCGAWMLFVLVRARQHSRWWLAAVLPIQILWCNTHGGFAIGWFVAGAFAAGQVTEKLTGITRRPQSPLFPWVAIALLTPLVCLVNPRGWDGLIYPLRLFAFLTTESFASMRAANQEGVPLFLVRPFPMAGRLFIASVVITVLALVAFVWTSPTADSKSAPRWRLRLMAAVKTFGLGYLILLPALAYLSQSAVRNVALYFFFMAPMGIVCLERAADAVLSHWLPRRSAHIRGFNPSLAALLALGAYVAVASGFAERRLGVGLTPSIDRPLGSTVDGPVHFIRQQKIRGPWFSDVIAANYFLYRLGPEYQVFIDSRFLEVYSNKDTRFVDYYLACLNEGAVFDSAAKQFGFQAVLLSFDMNVTHHLVTHLLRARDWIPVYLDGSGVIFLRNVSENRTVIRRFALAPPRAVANQSPDSGHDQSPLTALPSENVSPFWGNMVRWLCLGLNRKPDPDTRDVLGGQALAFMGYGRPARVIFERLAAAGTRQSIWSTLGNLRMQQIPGAALVAPLEDDRWPQVDPSLLQSVGDAYARALRRNSHNVAALSGAALMSLMQQEPERAFRLLERAMVIQDWLIPIRLLAGLAAERAGYRSTSDQQREQWWRRAEKHYTYLQGRSDCPVDARVRLALLYARQNRLQQALVTARQAIERGVPPPFAARLKQRISGL